MTATEDAPRWIEVDGRRWRATDPSIPDALRQELVDELMAARRAIGASKRTDDAESIGPSRARVQAAKVALGERGEPWWEPATDEGQRARMRAAILALSTARAPDRSICPSDAARAIGSDSWRPLLPLARSVAAELATAGELEVLQKGSVIDPTQPWKGPVRLRRIT